MSDLNTDEVRKDLPPKDKPQKWVEAKLHQTLDEIDRLREENTLGNANFLKMQDELTACRNIMNQIEQRTKEACIKAIDGIDFDDTFGLRERIEQAIESVGQDTRK